MEYDFRTIEDKWQARWKEDQTYKVHEDPNKEKFYVLDMFPYPSGAGLHVGHPLGYIASDVFARYKRHQGYNVLHPMGYDSFGLPAEQYAIETGQHPAITTENNIARYRDQLDKMGFCYDWSREVRTSDPAYYKWTQWIFAQLFESWYNLESNKAESIETLIAKFENNGSYNVQAVCDENWWNNLDRAEFPLFGEHFVGEFTATDWASMTEKQQQLILMNFRLTYLADSVVNWCPELGTVLANDEVKDGVSERGGFPVEQKLMRQWSMRITAYAQRLIDGLDTVDWSESIKEIQRNWIGRSEGASIVFKVADSDETIEVFSTRPDTIFGASFMVLAPEHELVQQLCTDDYKKEVDEYIAQARLKTERDRQSNVKDVSGQFIGAYALHPFTGKKLPIWIADYVLAGYGTGAVMAVPAGDLRDYDFAHKFQIPVPCIFEGADLSEGPVTDKEAVLAASDFLNGLTGYKAIKVCIRKLEEMKAGEGKINYRLRDAVFSRQRYWGEPFPIYYENDIPELVPDDVQVTLPPVEKYLPTADGDPPLANANKEDWNVSFGDRMEYNTMPGWAGSSWYFLRYMDPTNETSFCSREKSDYWNQVDLYIGGAEHGTGHLLYSRFWTKFLYDRGWIGFDEPFAKMINQGMILGRSSFVYRIKDSNTFVTFEKQGDHEVQKLYADISMVDGDVLDTEAFKGWREEYKDAEFILNDQGKYICGSEVEKMSKSKYNVQTPDDLCVQFGADTLRCYEMFLGPLEQAKPWDTKGISGVHGFLRKATRLYLNGISGEPATQGELKSLHKTIKKISGDLERYSFNTVVSASMICVNELTEQKCDKREILEPLAILISPYAPHLAEELWHMLGHNTSVVDQPWPQHNEAHLKEDDFAYPVSFNGKMRFTISLPADMSKEDVQSAVLAHEKTPQYLNDGPPKKVIVVPKRIVNIVV
jgi:leucyl-tRNA synthetase